MAGAIRNDYFRGVLSQLMAQGWSVMRTRKGHFRCQAPNGAMVFTSGTPSDHRAVYNFIAKLRRAGAFIA